MVTRPGQPVDDAGKPPFPTVTEPPDDDDVKGHALPGPNPRDTGEDPVPKIAI